MTRRSPLLELKHGALIVLALILAATAAPVYEEQTALEVYDDESGCYYNYHHYGEGDRIITNEPCLNCTCHNRMLMCYLRVCPFTKPIGQDCIVEKREDQCCPVITCPEVAVELVDGSTPSQTSELAVPDNYGCTINSKYYAEGVQVPSNPNKPCEVCYCIRNKTACVMQECTLHIDGCQPIYHKGVCCPVRYSCDHDGDSPLLLEDHSTTVKPTEGFVITTPKTKEDTAKCEYDGKTFADGENIDTNDPCKHCYCMLGDIVCAIPECGHPHGKESSNCKAVPPKEGQCCADTFICDDETVTIPPESDQEEQQYLLPPEKIPIIKGVKRPSGVTSTQKPKDVKVDKSSEEDSSEDMFATTLHHITTTEAALKETKRPIDTDSSSDEEEKFTTTSSPASKDESEIPAEDEHKPDHDDDVATEEPIEEPKTTVRTRIDDRTDTDVDEKTEQPAEEQTTQKHEEDIIKDGEVTVSPVEHEPEEKDHAEPTEIPATDEKQDEPAVTTTKSTEDEEADDRIEKTEAPISEDHTVKSIIDPDSSAEDEKETPVATELPIAEYPTTIKTDVESHEDEKDVALTTAKAETEAETQEPEIPDKDEKIIPTTTKHVDEPSTEEPHIDDGEQLATTLKSVELPEQEEDESEVATTSKSVIQEEEKHGDDESEVATTLKSVVEEEEKHEDDESKEATTKKTAVGAEEELIEQQTTKPEHPVESDSTDSSDELVHTTLKSIPSELEGDEVLSTEKPKYDEEEKLTTLKPIEITDEEEKEVEISEETTVHIPKAIDEEKETVTLKPSEDEKDSTPSIKTDHIAPEEKPTHDEEVTHRPKSEDDEEASGDQTTELPAEHPTIPPKFGEEEKTELPEEITSVKSIESDDKISVTTVSVDEKEERTTHKSPKHDEEKEPEALTEKSIESEEQPLTTEHETEKTTKKYSDFDEIPPKEIVTELPSMPSDDDVPESVTMEQMPIESDSHVMDESTKKSIPIPTEESTIRTDQEDVTTQKSFPSADETTVGQVDDEESIDMNTVVPEKVTDKPVPVTEPATYLPPTTARSDAEQTTHLPDTEEEDIKYPDSIPGEGDCLFNGITYKNNDLVPTADEECLKGCVCFNSIVRCQSSCDEIEEHSELPKEKEEDAHVEEVTKSQSEYPAVVQEITTTEIPLTKDEKTDENEIDVDEKQTSRPIFKAPVLPSESGEEIEQPEDKQETTSESHIQTDDKDRVTTVHPEEPISATDKPIDVDEPESHDIPTDKSVEMEQYTTQSPKDIPEIVQTTVLPESDSHIKSEEGEDEQKTETPVKKPHIDDRLGESDDSDQTTTLRSQVSDDINLPSEEKTEKPADKDEKVPSETTTQFYKEESEEKIDVEGDIKQKDHEVTTQIPREGSEEKTTHITPQEEEKDEVTEKPIVVCEGKECKYSPPSHKDETQTQAPQEGDKESATIAVEIGTEAPRIDESTTIRDEKIETPDQEITQKPTEDEHKPDHDDDVATEEPIEEPKTTVRTRIDDRIDTDVDEKTEQPAEEQTTQTHEEDIIKDGEVTVSPVEHEPEEKDHAEPTEIPATDEKQDEPAVTTTKSTQDQEADDRIEKTEAPISEDHTVKSIIDPDSSAEDEKETPVATELPIDEHPTTIETDVESHEDEKDVALTTVKAETEAETQEPEIPDKDEKIIPTTTKHVDEPSTEEPHIDDGEQLATTLKSVERPEQEEDESEVATTSKSVIQEEEKHGDDESEVATTLKSVVEEEEKHGDDESQKATTTKSVVEEEEEHGDDESQKATTSKSVIEEDEQQPATTVRSSDESEVSIEEHTDKPIESDHKDTSAEHDELTTLKTVEVPEDEVTSQAIIPTDAPVEHKEEVTTSRVESKPDETQTTEKIESDDVEKEHDEVTTQHIHLIDETTHDKPEISSDDQITEAPVEKDHIDEENINEVDQSTEKTDEEKTTEKTEEEKPTEKPVEVQKPSDEKVTEKPVEESTLKHEEVTDVKDEQEAEHTTVSRPESIDTKVDVPEDDEPIVAITELPEQPTTVSKESSDEHTTSKAVDEKVDVSVHTDAPESTTIYQIHSSDEDDQKTQKPDLDDQKTQKPDLDDQKTQKPDLDDQKTQKPDLDEQKTQKPEDDVQQQKVDHDQQVPEEPIEEPFSTTPRPVKQPTMGESGGYPQPPAYPSYDDDYPEEEEDPAQFGPGTCRYGGKLYVSAQQIPRDDPCDFCFCFRSDIICLQQSCPPPIQGCHEEPIPGFCCPRYECHVAMATVLNITTSTTTTTTTLPPHFLQSAYKGAARKSGCQIQGKAYAVGEEVVASSGPCMRCVCGGDANMKCEPKQCSPAPMLQQMIETASKQKRR